MRGCEEEVARASRRLRFDETASFKSDISWAGLPSKVILNFGEERIESGRNSANGVLGNGAFSMPGFGEMRNFWFSVGICSSEATVEERSCIVADAGRVYA